MWKRVVAVGIAPMIALAAPLAPLAAQGLKYQFDYQEPETVVGDQVTAEEAVARSNNNYGPPPPRSNCKQDPENTEIVVCAEEEQDQSEFRVQSTAQLDPEGKEATNDGLPRAPDVAGDGIFKGGGLLKFGSVPPPAIMFDISELPEAPEGSDADLIAQGKKKAD
jgi:hypothetical protein